MKGETPVNLRLKSCVFIGSHPRLKSLRTHSKPHRDPVDSRECLVCIVVVGVKSNDFWLNPLTQEGSGCNFPYLLLSLRLMDAERVKEFWAEDARESLRVAWHLYEKEDYSYALFFGHLAIEKMLKAIYVRRKGEQAPYIHNLLRLAEYASLPITDDRRNWFIKVTSFNLEARYPDERRTFRKTCTPAFTETQLRQIDEVFQWLASMLQ